MSSSTSTQLYPKRAIRFIHFKAFALLVCAVLVTSIVCLATESYFAVEEWVSLGGNIRARDELPVIGPGGISFGSAPGQDTSSDVPRIINSMRRLRRLPNCRAICLGDVEFTEAELESMLRAFRPVEITVFHCRFSDHSIQILLEQGTVRQIGIGRHCPVTSSGIRRLLECERVTKVSLDTDIPANEIAELKARFGERMWISSDMWK